MRFWSYLLVLVVLSVHAGTIVAQPEPVDLPVLAEVLGKKITERDLRPPPLLEKRWAAMPGAEAERQRAQFRQDRFGNLIMSPLIERYSKEHGLEATEDEVKEFLESPMGNTDGFMKRHIQQRSKEIRKQLESKDLDGKKRAELEEELAALNKPDWPGAAERRELKEQIPKLEERLRSEDLEPAERDEFTTELEFSRAFADLTDEEAEREYPAWKRRIEGGMARHFVFAWKVQRPLYTQYGGAIMWQQSGLEAVGATRTWLQEREKAGDFVIHDEALRKGFWKYYTPPYSFEIEKPTGKEFDKPMWLQMPEDGR